MNALSQPLRIFIVEDHLVTLEGLRLYLEQLGHSVASATTIRGALSGLSASPCDLLLTDMRLPDGSGWDLLQQIEPVRPGFVVAMSGLGMNSNRTRHTATGVRHFLTKPFHPDELDTILGEVHREVFSSSDME